eukprot:scaffold165684_cov32-Tisochrysis_lutea.AAC.3
MEIRGRSVPSCNARTALPHCRVYVALLTCGATAHGIEEDRREASDDMGSLDAMDSKRYGGLVTMSNHFNHLASGGRKTTTIVKTIGSWSAPRSPPLSPPSMARAG